MALTKISRGLLDTGISDSSDATAITIDSSERVGIGTASPNGKLHVYQSDASITPDADADDFIIEGNGATGMTIGSSASSVGSIRFADSGSPRAGMIYYNHVGNEMRFYTVATERLRIDASGNLGLSTTSPANYSNYTTLNLGQGGTGSILQLDGSTSGHYHLVQNNNGAMIISADQGNAVGSTTMNFLTDGSEKMRLDSSGNLLVGKTSSGALGTAGFELAANDTLRVTKSASAPVEFNRLSDDGYIVIFYKDTSPVGRIATKSGLLAIGDSDCGIAFEDGSTNHWYPWNIASEAVNDDGINLGASFARFDNIYATNNTINTSDRNQKQDEAAISDAEKKVAIAAKGLLKKFKFKSAVTEKGSDARIHFGIVAQDLKDAFTAEGLDASDYAMWCSDTWTDDDGNEQTRLGVRYSELLAFIIAGI